jgi:hypothetical protein
MKITRFLAALCSLMANASSVLPIRNSQLASPLEVKLAMAGNHVFNMSITNISPEDMNFFVAGSPLVEADTRKVSISKEGKWHALLTDDLHELI